MSEQLERNLIFLKKYKISLYNEVIDKLGQPSVYTLVQSLNGSPNLVYQDEHIMRHMYSKYDPENEAARWVETINNSSEPEDIIVYGVGLTYHLATYMTKYPTHQLYLYEPDINIFIESLKVISLEDLLLHTNIRYLAVGNKEEELGALFYNYFIYSKAMKEIVTIPYYNNHFTSKFQAFDKRMKNYIANFISQEQYAGKFGPSMHRNIFKNISKVLRSPSLKNAKEVWKGKSVIIVGSGPSLEKDLSLLKDLQERCIIVAAGTSIQTLLLHEIKPHLVVSMDAFTINFNAFSKLELSGIPFLFVPTIEYRILDKPNLMLMHAFFNHIEQYNYLLDLNETIDPVFMGSHSVTGTAIQAAIYMGAKQIIFTGQDLSYPNQNIYVAGTRHLSEIHVKQHQSEMTEQVENVEGNYNSTTVKMNMTLQDIETLINKFKEIEFINCSSGGAKIAGTSYMQLTQLQFSEEKYTREQFINEYKQFYQVHDQVTVIKVEDRLREQALWLDRLVNRLRKLKKQLSELEILSRTNFNRCEKLLRNVENIWRDIISHRFFAVLLEGMLIRELRLLDKMIPSIQSEQNLIRKTKLMREALDPVLDGAINQAKITVDYIKISIKEVSRFRMEGECFNNNEPT